MPLANFVQNIPAVTLGPGDQYFLFNAETLTAPANSIPFCPSFSGPVASTGITFDIEFAASPTDVLEIHASNIAPTSSGFASSIVVYTSTSKQSDSYTDVNHFAYYWAKLVSQTGGGACTVSVRM